MLVTPYNPSIQLGIVLPSLYLSSGSILQTVQ